MKFRLRIVLIALSLACSTFPGHAQTGVYEGLTYLSKGDYADAYRKLKTLADQGDANAQHFLGTMYEVGRGVPQDYKEAVKWYRLAAKQGNSLAQTSLGVLYAKGQGVPQDYKEAVKWYRLSAEQGLDIGQVALANFYAAGLGVPQDYKEAVKWYRRAADQGHAWAQNFLAGMYYLGRGVVENRVAAYALYTLSAATDPSPNNSASGYRAEVSKYMSAKEIEAGQALTREIAKPGNLLKALP